MFGFRTCRLNQAAGLRLSLWVSSVLLMTACASGPSPQPEPPAEPATQAPDEPAPEEDRPETERQSGADPEPGRPETTQAPQSPESQPAERETAGEPVEPIESAEPEEATEPEEPTEPVETTPEPESGQAETGEATTPEPEQPGAETSTDTSEQPTLNRRIEGRIKVLRNGREQGYAATYLNQTIVAWRPDRDTEVAPMEEQEIVTRRKRFFPQTLAVTSGTRVRFPNLDDIRHNVFSNTTGHKFDVGVYGPDEGATSRFDGLGMVEIYCNIHPNMAAFVLVLDTAHYTSPDQDGHFELENLPPGPGELLVWHYRAEERLSTRRLRDSNRLGERVEMTIDVTRPTVPQHNTKEGQPYNRRN